MSLRLEEILFRLGGITIYPDGNVTIEPATSTNQHHEKRELNKMEDLFIITDAVAQREKVRLNMRIGALNYCEVLNRDVRTDYEAKLATWKGEAERAAGLRQPIPQKPPVPQGFTIAPDDGSWNILTILGKPIEFTDPGDPATPYADGFFGPQEFMGISMDGMAIYNAKPGDQYPNGAEVTNEKGKFRKIRGMFNVGGGGYWVKVS